MLGFATFCFFLHNTVSGRLDRPSVHTNLKYQTSHQRNQAVSAKLVVSSGEKPWKINWNASFHYSKAHVVDLGYYHSCAAIRSNYRWNTDANHHQKP